MSDARPIDATDVVAGAEVSAAAASTESQPGGGFTTRVVRGSLWNLGGQAASLLATFVATPFVIRLLGVEGYGLLALINAAIVYLAFADMGMGWASTRFASEAHARGDQQAETKVIWTALLVGIGPALLISTILVIASRPLVVQGLRLPLHLHETAVIALRLAALAFVARAAAGVLNTPEMVRLRMDLVTLINVGTLIGQIILVPIVVYLGGGLIGAVAVIAGASLLSACLHAIVAVRLQPGFARPRFDPALIKPLIRFGGAVLIMSFVTMLLGNADKALVSRFASVQVLAYYAVALNLASMLTQAPMAMMQSLLPAFSHLQTKTDRSELNALYQRALTGTLLWIAPAAVLICVIARPFFTVWAGPEFGRESTLPLYVLAIGLIFEALAYVPFTLLIALGRADYVARIHGAMLVPYLVLASLAITWAGAVGVAAIWSLRALTSALAFTIIIKRITGFGFSPLPKSRQAYLIALVTLLLPVLLVSYASTSLAMRLGVTLVALIVHAYLIFTRVLTIEERTSLLRMLPWGVSRRFAPDPT
jgi:O-antigen/teichoic acid export membrane protein